MTILELREVTYTIDNKQILDKLSIEFWEGHVHAVVGPNGAGKSTLASVIMGLSGYRDIGGTILFKGQPINDLNIAERARLGITLAWQEPARFEGLSIRDFLKASARNEQAPKINDVLGEVGLEPRRYVERKVDKTLSGGERKKIELASILMMRPAIALLDEPDSGIDIESIERIFETVHTLKERGTTVILITHSLTVLDEAEHAFLLCNGQMVDKGPVDKIRAYFENKCLPCPHKKHSITQIEGAGS